ncbi:PEGA domain-containing protein [Bacteroidota bacterium]
MKYFFTLIILFFLTSPLFASEFIVKSFEKAPNDLSAQKYSKKDINDNYCAIIKIKTDLTGLKFDSNLGIEGDVKKQPGEYWLYVSPREQQIRIYKEGFIPLSYTIPILIESSSVYLMVLTYIKENEPEQKKQYGFILVKSEPQGADVYINGESMGKATPFQNYREVGTYRLKLKKELYYEIDTSFIIKANETTTISFNLTPNYGTLIIKTTPESDANILIDDGKYIDKTPLFIEKIEAGNHKLTINKEWYKKEERSFIISSGDTTILNIDLKPEFGTLIINSIPEQGAMITLDNEQLQNKTPFTLNKVSPGIHSLILRKEWYEPFSKQFEIKEGESLRLNLEIQPAFGEIHIKTQPEAEIFIDHDKKGYGIFRNRLTKGPHLIEIKKEKFYTQSKNITVTAGSEESYSFDLLPITGTISVMSEPPEASIYIDDKLYGTTPKIISDLIIGDYKLLIIKEGYSPIHKQVSITENETTSVIETLKSTVSFEINSDPVGAKVYINDQYQGFTPLKMDLPIGEQKIIIRKDQYSEKNDIIKIDGTRNEYFFKLDIKSAKINIKSKPNNASVFLNNENIGLTPIKNRIIDVGEYKLHLEKSKYMPLYSKLMINEDYDYKFQLQKRRKKYYAAFDKNYVSGLASLGMNANVYYQFKVTYFNNDIGIEFPVTLTHKFFLTDPSNTLSLYGNVEAIGNIYLMMNFWAINIASFDFGFKITSTNTFHNVFITFLDASGTVGRKYGHPDSVENYLFLYHIGVNYDVRMSKKSALVFDYKNWYGSVSDGLSEKKRWRWISSFGVGIRFFIKGE